MNSLVHRVANLRLCGGTRAGLISLVLLMVAREGWAQCMTIPGTSIQVGQGCFPQNLCPRLDTAIDPAAVPYNAPHNGVTDATSAISAALAAASRTGSGVKFSTPGTYVVNLTGRFIGGTYGLALPSNMTMECSAGVTLYMSATTQPTDSAILRTQNVSNVTVCGCDFRGSNSGTPPLMTSPRHEGMYLLAIYNGSNNILIEGNTFESNWGDAAVSLPTSDNTLAGASNTVIQYNTYSHMPYYSNVVDSAVSGLVVRNNLDIDSTEGAEWDACASRGGLASVGTAHFYNNMVMTTSAGNCRNTSQGTLCSHPGYASGMDSTNCDYSGMTYGGRSTAYANYAAGCIVDGGTGQCVTSSPWCGGTGQGRCTETYPAQYFGELITHPSQFLNNYLGTSGGAGNVTCNNTTPSICGAPGPAGTLGRLRLSHLFRRSLR
jgi:hypothetical protein